MVDQVRDASTLRVLISTSPDHYQMVTFLLSGIKAPTIRTNVPNSPDISEPFAAEAKYYVETRLLQRDVKVILEGISGNSLVGSILHPKGNIAELLLSEGMAKCVDWTLNMVSSGSSSYRSAEQHAKEKRLRLWKDFVMKPKLQPVGGISKEFEGIVTKILSGDTIVVEPMVTAKERKITLSSIRPPKLKDPKEAWYANEAKEYLRSRLISKTVKVVIDYTKPAEGNYEAKDCATVTLGDTNIAEGLVVRGLAFVIRHRKDDEDRSPHWDKLIIAEKKAQESQKGVYSTKDPPVLRISDASESLSKAKSFLSYLVRAKRVPGIVEYVSSGARFKVYVPSQNCKLTLVLSGIRCPRASSSALSSSSSSSSSVNVSATNNSNSNGTTPSKSNGGNSASSSGDKNEPFGDEALRFSTRKVFQHDVEIEIETTDKIGGFIGTLYIPPWSPPGQFAPPHLPRENLAVLLLEQGLATVHEYSASQSTHERELLEAEDKAKQSKLGLWSIEGGKGNSKLNSRRGDAIETETFEEKDEEVMVCDVTNDGTFYIQIMGSGKKNFFFFF